MSFPVYQATEWQCRYVFADQRCCGLTLGHDGEHLPVSNPMTDQPPAPSADERTDRYRVWIDLETQAQHWERDPDGQWCHSDDVDVLRAELTRLRAELAQAQAMVDDYQNKEAALCPEDVGIDEWCATMKKRTEAAEAKHTSLLIDLRAILDRAKVRVASQSWPVRDALLTLVHDLESRLQQEQGAD